MEIYCRMCKVRNGCPGIYVEVVSPGGKKELVEYYKLDEIRYCRNQLVWIISNMIVYNRGKYVTSCQSWLPEPRGETGYNDIRIQTSLKAEAAFEEFRRIIADVKSRLERTGTDGRILFGEVKMIHFSEEPGDKYGSTPPVTEYSIEGRSALEYMSGWREKRMGYLEWKRQRRYENKKR